MPNNEETYKKTGTAGAEGVDYQLNLILHVLLKVKQLKLDSFKLYTELKTAGKFDDVVLIYKDENKKERSCLLQAKHVIDESKKVSFNDLISGDKYSLVKYFDSFKKIIKEEQFKDSLEHLILFTNLNIDTSTLSSYVKVVQPQSKIWNYQMVEGNKKKPELYQLNSEFIDAFIDQYSQLVPCKKLKFSSKTKKNNEEKDIFKKFFGYLILALNQPNDGELDKSLTSDCVICFDQLFANAAKEKAKINIRQWHKTPIAPPLKWEFFEVVNNSLAEQEKTDTDLYVRSEIEGSLNQAVKFETLSLLDNIKLFMNAKEEKLLQITTRNSDLSSIKTISCLSKLNHEYLFTSKSEIRELKKVFSRSKCYNVFVWRILANSTSDFELFLYQLKDILNDIKDDKDDIKDKKVIVIMNVGQSVSAKQLVAAEFWIQQINDETKFGHLTEATRNILLKRNVLFQGCDIEINKILLKDFGLDQVAHDSWGELLSSGNIPIGQEVNLSKEYNPKYYIQRTIVQYLNEKEFIQHALSADQNDLVCEICILSDQAGMGKTTATSYLADEAKSCYPHYWMTRLVATQCASELSTFGETKSDAAYDEFFMSKLLKLSSPLERYVFGQYLNEEKSVNKLVLIFDGYDEINENYHPVIVNLLQYLSRKPNVGFIVITTRPQFQQNLEEHFHRKACILRPFDEENKIDFLQKYWDTKDKMENTNRLREYAKQLITCISGSISEEDSQLTGIPLQMSMIAVIYEEKARSFVLNGKWDSGLMSLGLFDLYKEFMKIKESICLKDKMKDEGLAFNPKMIKSVQQHQTKFAREIILGRLDVSKVETTDLELTTQLGIIQKNPEGEFYFIHRTFAEFLTAKYLLEDFIDNDSVSAAVKIKNGLLIEQIKKTTLNVVRKFINSRLNSAKLAEECKGSEEKRTIQRLMGDNCTEIIITSAMEEIHEFIKLTIEVNSWLSLDQLYTKLAASLMSVAYSLKFSTVIQDCMLEKWLPNEGDNLIKTIDILIRGILVQDNEYMFSINALTASTIVFQNKLEREGVLTEEKLRNILSIARGDVVNHGKYWNWSAIEYFQHLHSTNRNLFYDFFNDNRTLLHTIMKKCVRKNLRDFLSLIESDKEIDANWVFNNFLKCKFVEFGGWEDVHLELYFSFLRLSAGELHSERKEEIKNYLKEVILFLYPQYDLSFMGLFAKFLMSYAPIISLEELISNFHITKTTEDLQYCALWGQTNKLKDILNVLDIETAAVERFQLVGGTQDQAAIRRSILSSIKEEEFLQWIEQRNHSKKTFLQHALLKEDDLIIKLMSKWITTEEIFEKTMRMDYDTTYYKSEFESFLNFVDEKLPKYRMRFLELNKNIFCLFKMAREALFQMIEKYENMSQIEFVQILKLQVDFSGYKGSTILHRILLEDDIGILPNLLNLVKKFQLDAKTISQLFCIKDEKNESPLDFIKYDSNHAQRQEKKKICFEFFVKLNLLELKKEIENLE